MAKDNFFEKQSNLTTAKIKIFKEYISGYLIKILMSYKSCVIVDLFCGPGKNGDTNGSPLVLLNELNYILSVPQLNNDLKVEILFNDQNEKFTENLKNEVSNIKFNKNVINVKIINKEYGEYIDCFLNDFKNNDTPKFIFLDPFSLSDVKMDDLKKIMSLPNTEILFFIPIFHSYRFAKEKLPATNKMRKFIEEFTSRGIANYRDVYDFMFSIREQLILNSSRCFVRQVLLDHGSSKNALFLLTKHHKGMLLMNKVVWKNSSDGITMPIENLHQETCFNPEESSLFLRNFNDKLIGKIKTTKQTNKQIVDFTIQQECLPKHAKMLLAYLMSKGKIKVFDENNQEINNKNKWNIAEKITTKTIFKWIG
jgi:three-Cys-motif partner protein